MRRYARDEFERNKGVTDLVSLLGRILASCLMQSMVDTDQVSDIRTTSLNLGIATCGPATQR